MIVRCGNWSVSNTFQSKDTKLSQQFQVQSRNYEYVGKIDTFSIKIHGFGYKGTRDDSTYCTVPEAIKFYNAIGGYVCHVILKIYIANSTILIHTPQLPVLI
jgi:hypothetical protein